MSNRRPPTAVCKVASLDGDRLDMTLDTSDKGAWTRFKELRMELVRTNYVKADEWMREIVGDLYIKQEALGLVWTDHAGQSQKFKDLAEFLIPNTQQYLLSLQGGTK